MNRRRNVQLSHCAVEGACLCPVGMTHGRVPTKNVLRMVATIAALLVVWNGSCSGADPIIYDINWHIQAFRNDDGTAPHERMVVLLLADDDDGFKEIYELYVIHDVAELYWRITSDEWSLLDINERKWIGVSTLYMPRYEEFPRGTYRVLLRDLSGYKSEKRFSVSEKNFRYTMNDIPRLSYTRSRVFEPVSPREASLLLQLLHPHTHDAFFSSKKWGKNGATYSIGTEKPLYFLSENTQLDFRARLYTLVSPHLFLLSETEKNNVR